jgi:E3 ubiquitin-protein ligase RNF216
MDEVIEISSSPEPPTRSSRDAQAKTWPSKTLKQRIRAGAPVAHEDEVIELTDSEDNAEVKKCTSGSNGNIPVKGSQRKRPEAQPSHPVLGTPRINSLLDGITTHGGSSAAGSVMALETPKARKQPKAEPLFLPDDEEDGLPPPISQAKARYPAPIVVDDIPDELLESNLAHGSPSANIDPMDTYVARILEIIPDVQPTYILSLLEQHAETRQDNVVEVVLHALFEDPKYPKIDKKGKRKREEGDDEGEERGKSKVKVDYGNKDRVKQAGPLYSDIALVFIYSSGRFLTDSHHAQYIGTTSRGFPLHTQTARSQNILREQRALRSDTYFPCGRENE